MPSNSLALKVKESKCDHLWNHPAVKHVEKLFNQFDIAKRSRLEQESTCVLHIEAMSSPYPKFDITLPLEGKKAEPFKKRKPLVNKNNKLGFKGGTYEVDENSKVKSFTDKGGVTMNENELGFAAFTHKSPNRHREQLEEKGNTDEDHVYSPQT